ncbi:MAG TPA: hypothetical protein VGS58_13510, partial [Candidatus Sulfopaludibacter sp.]|nr:hypothetical protein [Candidatus Sulfopaludibacter sp.]
QHPRLFLRPNRLRLLRRERQRASMRWQQFDSLMAGNAPMPEPAFAEALYYQVAGNADSGKRAVAWALGSGTNDLRQLALVFDWCQDLLSEAQQRSLAERLQKRLADTAADESLPAMRSRTLAAVALFDHVPQMPQRELDRVRSWWNGKIVAAIKSGRDPIARDDAYALMELFHAMRDNTNLDLRESAGAFFKDFPIDHLLSYYPAAWPAPENDYYIGATRQTGDPDLRLAALSRAAELAMVAYDVNAPETQVLQGWLMHDKFLLRGSFGVPYEFMWANPYQPGLSYYHVPLIFYNPEVGRLFVRSSWNEDAAWFGYFDGVAQLFSDAKVTALNPQIAGQPMSLGEAVICMAHNARRFEVKLDDEDAVFLIGLRTGRAYQVEVDDEEMYETAADKGGILALTDVPRGRTTSIRLKELP